MFPVVAALESRGATVVVHDPMFTDEELEKIGLVPFHLGGSADVAIVQADHRDYAQLAPADVQGVRLLVDGRRVTDAALWQGVPRLVIGTGAPA